MKGVLLVAVLVIAAAGCGSPIIGPALDGEPSIPPPRPVSTGEYRVGAYYFPGWPTREKWRQLDAKPVVSGLCAHLLRSDMGSGAVGAAVRLMRARTAAAGLPGLFLVAIGLSDGADLSALRAEGYDATTGYNYPRAGMPDRAAL